MGKLSRHTLVFGALVAASLGALPAVANAETALTSQEQVFVSYLQAHGELLTDHEQQTAAIDVGKADCNAIAAGVTREQLVENLPGGATERDEAVLFLDAATAPGSLCG